MFSLEGFLTRISPLYLHQWFPHWCKYIFVSYSVDGCLINYHTSNSCYQWISLAAACSLYKKTSFCENLSGMTSHVCASEDGMKLKVCMTCTLVQTATNLWYFPVYICTMVILVYYQLVMYYIGVGTSDCGSRARQSWALP